MSKDNGGPSFSSRVRRLVFGAPRDITDRSIFHRISLIAFLAWVGLGADGLSSSSYGPDEAFRAIGHHTYLAVALALATAFTVFIISYAYSRIIEHFPFGGGGYVVASKLLGPKFGVISGSALLVDYVLTISVSIASGADQIISILPPEAGQFKLFAVTALIVLLMLLNLRGVKESVTVLMPIFLLFVVCHVILIFGGIGTHLFEVGRVVQDVQSGYRNGIATLGLAGMFAIFGRAYSLGAGTYTGIEAVSNGIQIMREPKVETARRTMLYMAVSLAVTAGGILLCYLLFEVTPEAGKTMNAVLVHRFAGGWGLAGLPLGGVFIIVTLASESLLLLVAAQTGFIDGPRVMANMSGDSWLPHRFSSLSDRLTMGQGVILISVAALLTLVLTRGNTGALVLMYSINVFLTFSLSQMGMVRYWIRHRKTYRDWSRHITIHIIGLILCLSILTVSVLEKFTEGGWVTLLVTAALVGLCFLIKKHYNTTLHHLKRLDDILKDLPVNSKPNEEPVDRSANTAVLMVERYGGFGIHALLSVIRLFPNHFKNFVFVSITQIDSATLKGIEEVHRAEVETEESLKLYVHLAQSLGFRATFRRSVGTEVLPEAEKLIEQIAREFPRSIVFMGKLIFQRERWYQRLLHNETASQLQRRLQFQGVNTMVLPLRVFDAATVP